MSKSSTVSAQKIPAPLPTKSAWSKGPPTSNSSAAPSPRSSSPAPSNATPPASATHSRRPSTLGQGIPIKDGVSVPRSTMGAVKQGSAVTFGSIDNAGEPIPSSSASATAVKSEGIKSFGTVPADSNLNGKSTSTTAPTPKPTLPLNGISSSASSSTTPATTSSKPMAKVDIKKLFQGPGSSQPTSSSETASPSPRPSNLPTQQQPQSHPSQPPPQQVQQSPPSSQPSQMSAYPYASFVPGRGPPTQNNGPARGPPGSPVYNRQQLANGSGRPPGGPNGPGGPPMSAGLSSPRISHQHPGQQQPGMPPPPLQWGQPYGYGDPYMQQYFNPGPGWYMATPGSPLPQHAQHVPQQHQPPGPPGPPHMPMSPRPHPHQIPGTPTQTHAIPNSAHPSHAPTVSHSNSASLSNISSPPQTPSSSSNNNLPSSGSAGARLNTNASAFVPGRSKVVIKSADGNELDLSALRKVPGLPGNPGVGSFNQPSNGSAGNRKSVVRMESEETKKKRMAEEKAKEEAEQAKREAEEKAKRDAEEKAKREEEEKIAAAAKKEEEERERARKEEEERIRKEEEEKERIRKEAEEKERLAKEEEERLKKEEEERLHRAEEEKRVAEEAERARKEEEAKAKAAAEAQAAAMEKEKEEGELPSDIPFPSKEKLSDVKEEAKFGSRENLRIDTTSTPPAAEPRKRPGPLNLTGARRDSNIPAALPSALSTARIIEDIGQVPYPEGIQSPKVELNIGAKDGKFKYDRDFLLQFMSICKEKPDMLPPLDAIGLEPSDQTFPMSRGGSGRQGGRTTSLSGQSRSASVGLGIGNFSKSGAPNPFSMGNFATPGSKMSSEERFALANSGRAVSVGGPAGLPFGRPPAMTRTPSQGGQGGHPSNRTRSKRGEKRGDTNKTQGHQQSHGSGYGQQQTGPGGIPLEPVAPLEQSANRWTAASTSRKPQAIDPDSPEIVDRKVKALLNKLTMEKFDSISDQIITWANKSETEKDGRTLIQVIRLVFEKATDEAAWSEMYARLCRKMMEQISPKVQDDSIKNSEGKPIAGGQLFRKYLLNRCQEDFERGWAAKDAAAAAAAAKASEDNATKAANEKNKDGDDEPVLYSDEYYASQKAKRQGLGLIKFIGELFKLQMLTERIMHECVKKLLGNVENPEEEEIESLCKLLSTVGAILDTNKARAHMDVYFSRMRELTKSGNVTSRMQFMLQDVIELRDRKWISRTQIAAPSTIAQIHEGAAKDRAAAEKESYQRQISMSRGGSRRGGDRGQFDQQVGPDGWAVAGGTNGPTRPPPKAGDLSNFGKITKGNSPMTFGPGSVFAGKKDGKGRGESLSRTNSSSNMFSMLSQNPEMAAEAAASKSSRPASRKTSVDLGQSGVPEAPAQRRKLQLLPRSKPADEEVTSASANQSEDGEPEDTSMSEAEIKKKIDEDSKEFFGVRNLEEADEYFKKLPSEHRFRLVDKLVNTAIESKETDAQLVGNFFYRASSNHLCSPESFEEGFASTAEILDDIAIDAPKAFDLMAIMMKGAGLDKERQERLASKTIDSDKLVSLLLS